MALIFQGEFRYIQLILNAYKNYCLLVFAGRCIPRHSIFIEQFEYFTNQQIWQGRHIAIWNPVHRIGYCWNLLFVFSQPATLGALDRSWSMALVVGDSVGSHVVQRL